MLTDYESTRNITVTDIRYLGRFEPNHDDTAANVKSNLKSSVNCETVDYVDSLDNVDCLKPPSESTAASTSTTS